MSTDRKKLFECLLDAFKENFAEYLRLRKKLDFRTRWMDFFSVARNAGFVMVPAFLSGVIFLFLSQGRDTLLLVVEKMADGNYWPLLFLLFGVICWSGSSELSVRYAIAIADNSGKSLNDDRVKWRKFVQKILAEFFLVWPLTVITVSLVWCYLNTTYMPPMVKDINFGICIICLYLVLIGYSYLYFDWKKGRDKRFRKTILGTHSLSNEEKTWLNKLYGIYNEYVFDVPKATNFRGDYREEMAGFTKNVTETEDQFRDGLPQNTEVMTTSRRVPGDFKLLNKQKIITDQGDAYKWLYEIPVRFYPKLHKQVIILSSVSVLFLVVVSFISAKSAFFSLLGAPALLCFAFACYSGVYAGLLFLDYGLIRHAMISVRLFLIALLIISSIFNKDHPVRMCKTPSAARNSVLAQYHSWFANYKKQLDVLYPQAPDTAKYPVVFICAEGGALRTGAYTSIFLTSLQHRLNDKNIDFKKSVFAMSGVSGGALGLSYYNAKAFESADGHPRQGSDVDDARRFFLYDALSPVIGKMLYGDFLNLFIPCHIDRFDRAIALEESWENAYALTLDKNEHNRFAESFVTHRPDPLKPVLIINTSEIETGYQCWITNAVPDSILFQSGRDLLKTKVNDISYSTAVNFSTRFPLFSPGAEISGSEGGRYHYLDGGYVENTGTGSMLELLQILEKNIPGFKQVTPIVIYLRFSEGNNSGVKDIHIGNEITEIINGIYNTRVGRSFTAMQQLSNFTLSHHGVLINEPLSPTEKQVPMNWVLSGQSMNNILLDINKKLDDLSATGICPELTNRGLHFLPSNAPH